MLDAATGAVLDTRTVSSFDSGDYLAWNVSGHVVAPGHQAGRRQRRPQRTLLRRSRLRRRTATFVATDATTQGSWKGAYGAEGYDVIGDTASYPATPPSPPRGQSTCTWAASTDRLRALQKAAAPPTGSPPAGTPAQLHGRRQPDRRPGPRAEPLRASTGTRPAGPSGSTCSTRPPAPCSTRGPLVVPNGDYLTWNVTGHVQLGHRGWAASTPSSADSSSARATPPQVGHVPRHGHDDARELEGGLRRRRVQRHQQPGQLSQLRHRDPLRPVVLHLGGEHLRRPRPAEGRRHRPDRRHAGTRGPASPWT